MKIRMLLSILLLAGMSAITQTIPYTNCDQCWNPDSLGNHRVVLQYGGTGKMARAVIPWRRNDQDPQLKRIIVVDGKTQQKIANVNTGKFDRESGEIYFEPVSGSGIYHV